MSEREFLELLEKRAGEQRRMVKSSVLPPALGFIGEWLGVHPWRVIVPVSVLSYMLLRLVLGVPFRDFVLGIFGGYRLL